MVRTRSGASSRDKPAAAAGQQPHRLEVRLRSRETDRRGGMRSVQVQAAVPMDTSDTCPEVSTSSASATAAPHAHPAPSVREKRERGERESCAREYAVPRKRARSVSPEPDKESSVEGGAWRDGDSTEADSEEEEPLPPGDRVAYIHVGEGGEADLEAQLKGAENLDIQILEEEDLPDIDETDMIHGLDHTGTARDYVDQRHRCTINCPVGCQGHLRPNEIVIYESFKFEGRLRGRKRYKGRIIYNIRYRDARDQRSQETSSTSTTGSGSESRSNNSSSRSSTSSSVLSSSSSSSSSSSVSSSSSSSSRSAAQKARLDRHPKRRTGGRESGVQEHTPGDQPRVHRRQHRDQRLDTQQRRGGEGERERRSHGGQQNSNKDTGGGSTSSSAPTILCLPKPQGRGVFHYKLPARLDLLLDMPRAGRETQVRHSWNTEDRSLNIYVKDEDPLTFHRHPVAQSTDCIRSKVGYEAGLHVFEVTWPVQQRGTHAVVGVGTLEAPLHSVGYQSLIGNNDQTWGWDLGRNKAYHDSNHKPGLTYPQGLGPDETFQVPDKFYLVLDMDEGTMSFIVDGHYLGVAHRGLRGHKVYVVISAVWGHCEISMKYVNGLEPGPLPLMSLSRLVIRHQIGKDGIDEGDIESLNLPKTLKNYLRYQESLYGNSEIC